MFWRFNGSSSWTQFDNALVFYQCGILSGIGPDAELQLQQRFPYASGRETFSDSSA